MRSFMRCIVGAICVLSAASVPRAAAQCGFDWRLANAMTQVDGPIYAAVVFNDGTGEALFVGGDFDNAGGSPAANLAKWNGTSWSAVGGGVNGVVRALAVHNGALAVGGQFSMAGMVQANNVALWNGVAFSALGTGTSAMVRALASFGGALVAGGEFASAGGVTVNYVARWNGAAWSDMAGGMSAMGVGATPIVRALAAFSGELIAGGGFTIAGGVPVNYIARWNGTSWLPLGSGMDQAVHALGLLGADLVAGGAFNFSSGVFTSHVARWNGSFWSAFGLGRPAEVSALSVFNGALIAGGGFTGLGPNGADSLARWNGATWDPLGAGVDDRVDALAAFDDELIAGGAFLMAGGSPSAYFARWGPAIGVLPDITQPPASQTICPGATAQFSVTATGSAPLSYQWRKDGMNIPGATAATYEIATAQTSNNGQYDVVVTNPCGMDISDPATLEVSTDPTITQHPVNTITTTGDNLTLVVLVNASSPTFQWRLDGINLTDSAVINGATTNVLFIRPVDLTHAGNYDVVVTSAGCTVISSTATVNVTPGIPNNNPPTPNPNPMDPCAIGLCAPMNLGGLSMAMMGLAWLRRRTRSRRTIRRR